MQISEAQERVARQHSSDEVRYLSAVERLIDALMTWSGDPEWCGKFPIRTDGVLFEYQDSGPDHFVGHGVAIVGERPYVVEPIIAEFCFDSALRDMVAAKILFGSTSSTKPIFGSREAKRLAKSMLAAAPSGRLKNQIDWRYSFSLVEGSWSVIKPTQAPTTG